MSDFLDLVRLLKDGEIVSREEVQDALAALEGHEFSFATQKDHFRDLLTASLGGDPDAFYAFRMETQGLIKSTPEEIEEELRVTAADLYGDSWQTPLWDLVCEAVEHAQLDEWEDFEEILDQVEDDIESSWQHYSELKIGEEEVTQETIIGHRLLLEGLQTWLDAVSQLFEAAEGKESWETGLESAEWGNRLLVTSEIYARRLARA